jgi:hypothetical protein
MLMDNKMAQFLDMDVNVKKLLRELEFNMMQEPGQFPFIKME